MDWIYGKTVLITGASSGLGRCLTLKLIKEQNCKVIGIGISEEKMLSLKQELTYKSDSFSYFTFDVSVKENWHELANKFMLSNQQVDLLINNAGISIIGLLQDLTKDFWNNIWNTNVTSAISLSKALIPLFLRNGHGKIINISSVWGERGASCEVAYSATKGAINSFTKALAKELAPSNIQVNALSCGIIDTKMNSHLSSEDISSIIEEIPAERMGTPQDVADAVLSLTDFNSYMTGQIITIDGGWMV